MVGMGRSIPVTSLHVLSLVHSEPLVVRRPSLTFRRPAPGATGSAFEVEFTRLFDEQFPRLFRYLNRQAGDSGVAADAAQEAFIRLFTRGEMPDDPAAWLVTVASNVLRDDRRRAGRHLRLLGTKPEGVAMSTPPLDPAASLESTERRAMVRAAMARIADRDRDALLLRHGGYSYREIALALDLNPSSVGTILLRATAAFRRAWGELYGAEA
jgi:RNA polymerase sigma-70 factor (ECF subfamily)